jgi:hypothetical protein
LLVVDLGQPGIGDGPAGGGQAARLVHLAGRIVRLSDEPVVLGVPVQAAQHGDQVLGGAASAAGVAAGYGVCLDMGHQVPDL